MRQVKEVAPHFPLMHLRCTGTICRTTRRPLGSGGSGFGNGGSGSRKDEPVPSTGSGKLPSVSGAQIFEPRGECGCRTPPESNAPAQEWRSFCEGGYTTLVPRQLVFVIDPAKNDKLAAQESRPTQLVVLGKVPYYSPCRCITARRRAAFRSGARHAISAGRRALGRRNAAGDGRARRTAQQADSRPACPPRPRRRAAPPRLHDSADGRTAR